MGLELVVLGFFGIIGIGVFVALAWGWGARDRDRISLDRAWRSYARARALEHEPSSGEWPSRRTASLSGAREGTSIVIDTVTIGEHVHTRLRATPEDTLLGRLHVETRARSEAQADAYSTLDPSFDMAFVVTSSPRAIADRVLDAALRKRLCAFRMGRAVTFTYERGTLALVWQRAELNHARLDEAFALMDAALSAVAVAYEAPSQSRIEHLGVPQDALLPPLRSGQGTQQKPRKLRVVR